MKNREKYNAMYGGNEEWQDPVRAFRANYRRFYYRYIGSDDNRSQMIKEIKGSDFTFAADGNRIAELIKDMLSYPDKRRYENNVAFCEKVISEYCCILAENDCLPDMEIPGRYLPHTCRGNDTVQMVVQLCTQMCCRDGYKSEWNEYRAFRLKDGDVQNVPLVFCRTDPGSFPFREIAENMLFLTVRDGKIFYRVMLDENGLADGGRLVLLGSDGAPCFGELTADSKLSFCVREKIDGTQVETHKITLSVAVPQQKTTDHAPEERLIWGLT